ncbi:MAG TPA: hypothetical protein VK501_10510 [Baekduia sp.]|uniref:hypothetical protein n=1 Tax=Baekduia sp. TaxID=2600305 RepID=UPI002C8F3464|nr:hypothetical protein [Baekduia sp.]HMJ34341.1 hypothetical protein [Baekduia sp.]
MLAKQILGFGNRSLVDASRAFGGYSYMLVGVEPGHLHGVEVIDPAKLSDIVRPYVAGGRPSWAPTYVSVDGVEVLVVEIAPPQPGDRICCLMKTYESAKVGLVYVRREGQTEQADPHEIRELEERLLSRSAEEARRVAQREEGLIAAATAQGAALEARVRQSAEVRARQRAPRLEQSTAAPFFSFAEPHRMEGRLKNTGESAASVSHVRLHREGGGAVPGGIRSIYPSGSSSPELPADVPPGIDLGLVFDHAVLTGVANEQLIVVLEYEDDSGFHWKAEVPLHRHGKDHLDHQRWRVGDATARML